jgi:anti-sigma regulatory factor (Ser/Thr protein kinase)
MPGEVTSPGSAAETRRSVLTVRHAIGKPLNPPVRSAGDEAEHICTRSFPGRLDQVREARAFAAGLVKGSPVADDVVLCVSEFSANAVLHSHSRERDGRFMVRVEVHAPDYTWVEVEDGGGPWEPHPDESLAGHGLDIVTRIASEWGIDGSLHGWIVWARLDWPRS